MGVFGEAGGRKVKIYNRFFAPLLTPGDDLGRVVIPKEIRRTMRIREGDPSPMTWNRFERFCFAMLDLAKRMGVKQSSGRPE